MWAELNTYHEPPVEHALEVPTGDIRPSYGTPRPEPAQNEFSSLVAAGVPYN